MSYLDQNVFGMAYLNGILKKKLASFENSRTELKILLKEKTADSSEVLCRQRVTPEN